MTSARVHLCQRDVSGHSCASINLHSTVHHLAGHPSCCNFDHSNLGHSDSKVKHVNVCRCPPSSHDSMLIGQKFGVNLYGLIFLSSIFYLFASSTVALCIQSVSSTQRQQSGLFYHETALGDPVSDNLLHTRNPDDNKKRWPLGAVGSESPT